MADFEPGSSGVGSDCSTNCATTNTKQIKVFTLTLAMTSPK